MRVAHACVLLLAGAHFAFAGRSTLAKDEQQAPAPACTYVGNYRIEAVGRVGCGVEFLSYGGGSPTNQASCDRPEYLEAGDIELRTKKQLPKADRSVFEITAEGDIKTVRRGCTNQTGEAYWTPGNSVGDIDYLSLRYSKNSFGLKWVIKATGSDCNLVTIESDYTDAYLKESNYAPFVTSPESKGECKKSRTVFLSGLDGLQTFRLRKV